MFRCKYRVCLTHHPPDDLYPIHFIPMQAARKQQNRAILLTTVYIHMQIDYTPRRQLGNVKDILLYRTALDFLLDIQVIGYFYGMF